MKCLVGHEIKTERGFRVFEAGVDYPESEIGDRVRYFEVAAAGRTQKNNRAEPDGKALESEIEKPKRGKKINEEVEL
jgi:hypothetical protein